MEMRAATRGRFGGRHKGSKKTHLKYLNYMYSGAYFKKTKKKIKEIR
jgi:hypothetical protein